MNAPGLAPEQLWLSEEGWTSRELNLVHVIFSQWVSRDVCPKAFLKIKGYISLDKALGISVEWKMSFLVSGYGFILWKLFVTPGIRVTYINIPGIHQWLLLLEVNSMSPSSLSLFKVSYSLRMKRVFEGLFSYFSWERVALNFQPALVSSISLKLWGSPMASYCFFRRSWICGMAFLY